MKKWDKYIKKNSTWCDCQLVTACNAATYLGLPAPEPGDALYEGLTGLCGCQHGAATSIQKVHRRLGIKRVGHMGTPYSAMTMDLPIEISVWHIDIGYHSCLIVERVKKCKALRVLNFNQLTNSEGWVFFKELASYMRDNPDSKKRSMCQSFSRRKK